MCSKTYAILPLERISKAGFIATPTKWEELSVVEDLLWLGYYHHRWIFDFKSDREIQAMPKSVATNRSTHQGRVLYAANPATIARRIVAFLNFRQSGWLLGPDMERREPRLRAEGEHELSFVWRERIPFDLHDYYPTARALLDDCREMMKRRNEFALKPLDPAAVEAVLEEDEMVLEASVACE